MATENKQPTISKTGLKKIIEEAEQELAGFLKSEKDKLAKGGEQSPGEGGEGSPAPDEGGSPAGGPPAGAPPAGPEGSASAPPPPAAEGSSPAAGPDATSATPSPSPEGDPAAGGDPAAEQGADDPAALEAEYAKIGAADPEKLKAHYLAAKAALMQIMAASAGPDGAGAPPAGPPAGAPPAGPEASGSAPVPPPMGKGEMKPGKGNGQYKPTVAKSEADQKIEALTKRFEEQATMIDNLVKVFDTTLGQPIRKSVKGLSEVQIVGKPEASVEGAPVLTRDEISAKLTSLTADPKLSKSDRDLILGYYDKRHGLDKISHLLK